MNLKSSLCLLSLAAMLAACSNVDDLGDVTPDETLSTQTRQSAPSDDMFARRDGEKNLTGAYTNPEDYSHYYNDPAVAEHVNKLMCEADTNMAASLNGVEITEEHLNELKEFVEGSILTNETRQYNKMMAILKWIRANIKYGYNDQDAYSVFVNRVAVCQGYSNLMVAMLHTQGIKATVATGFLANAGGHAWVYALADGTWYVADPTNRNTVYRMKADVAQYKATLQPWNIDMPLASDDKFVYDFRDKHFNIREVLTSDEQVSVPYGALGYRITAFDPIGGINENVRELYLSLNIASIGQYALGLKNHGANLTDVYVLNAENRTINEYDGCVYSIKYTASTKKTTYLKLLYVPGAKREIKYPPVAAITGKLIENLPNVEVIRFDEVTLDFQDYAITSCPNLKEIYINQNATASDKAFDDLPAGCRIIRYDPLQTGIRPIYM
ncbi:MAG: transglutaminase domain-containing protein [Bacteroidaceae bacterium]|nr:transglutaminase domain-containing protein [Bacteroidaceae bacterium]